MSHDRAVVVVREPGGKLKAGGVVAEASRGAVLRGMARLRGAALWLDEKLRGLALGLIRGYKFLLSPLFPGGCRFWPSCSDYAAESFRRFHFFRALRLTTLRLLKCNPWHPGGEDLPPER